MSNSPKKNKEKSPAKSPEKEKISEEDIVIIVDKKNKELTQNIYDIEVKNELALKDLIQDIENEEDEDLKKEKQGQYEEVKKNGENKLKSQRKYLINILNILFRKNEIKLVEMERELRNGESHME